MEAIINNDNKTVTTINPTGQKAPQICDFSLRHFYKGTQEQYDSDRDKKTQMWSEQIKKWEEAEGNRRTIEIDRVWLTERYDVPLKDAQMFFVLQYSPGTIHKIEITESGKANIISY